MTLRRRSEVLITVALLALVASGLTLAVVVGNVLTWADALTRLAFATVIALAVRWLGIWFESIPRAEDIYKSTGDDLRRRIDHAESRVWILQTWLPQIDADAKRIIKANAQDTRLILGSFRFDKDSRNDSSMMYARIWMRKIDIQTALTNSASSFMPFHDADRVRVVRYNPIHHPGWIAILDEDVFWGQTPLDGDNWNVPQVCHRAKASEWRAKYWVEQFLLLWPNPEHEDTTPNWLHGYETERKYNSVLDERLTKAGDLP